jgi:hypothetical protein
MWMFRVMSHVPGYRWYSKRMLRGLEKHFWRTYLTTCIATTAGTVLGLVIMNWGLKHMLEEQKTITIEMTPEEAQRLRKDLAKV